jgi:hypothetical protein
LPRIFLASTKGVVSNSFQAKPSQFFTEIVHRLERRRIGHGALIMVGEVMLAVQARLAMAF